jgi:hypothetical protein
LPANRFAHTPFQPIAIHRFADRPWHRKPEAGRRCLAREAQTEGGEIAACHADTVSIGAAKLGGSNNPAWFWKCQRIKSLGFKSLGFKSGEPRLLRLADGALIAYRQFVAAFRASPRQYRAAIGALHARAKTVGLGALSIVRLKCTFGHGNPYLRVLKQVETYRPERGKKRTATSPLNLILKYIAARKSVKAGTLGNLKC